MIAGNKHDCIADCIKNVLSMRHHVGQYSALQCCAPHAACCKHEQEYVRIGPRATDLSKIQIACH